MNNTSRKVDSVSGKSTTQANGETLKECSDLEQRSAVGKRFARRAKRWAELQQRRQNSRNAHAALYSRAFAPLSVQSDSFLAASTQAFVRKPTRVTSNRGTSCGQYACCAYEQARYVHSCFVNSSARTPQLIEHVSNAQLINVKLATMGVGMAPFSESSTEFRYPQGRMCGERLSGSFFDDPTDAMIMSRAPTAGKPGSPDMLRSSQKHRYYQPDAGEPEDHVRFGQYFIMNAGSKQEAFVSVYQLPAELHVYPNTAASTKHTAVVHLDTSSSSSSSISSSYSSKASSSRARDEYSSSSSDEDLISWIASDLANVSIQCGDGTSCPFDIGDVKSRLDELRQPPPLPDSSLACCANDVIEATESKEGWYWHPIPTSIISCHFLIL
ncbi:unnamed protein product [Toxocara canis]|nr:unnamed protein product [Toxocara canis]